MIIEQAKLEALRDWAYQQSGSKTRLEISAEVAYHPVEEAFFETVIARVYLAEPRCVTMGMHLQCEHDCECLPLAEKRLA